MRIGSQPSIQQQAQAEGLFSMEEAAARAGVSYRTLSRYVSAGLVHPRIETREDALGVRYWFSEADIQRASETKAENLRWVPIGLRDYFEKNAKTNQRPKGEIGTGCKAPVAPSVPLQPAKRPNLIDEIVADLEADPELGPLIRRVQKQH